jgi:hypothetical protein
MLQRSVLSSVLSPGAVDAGGKSVGSCTSVLSSSSFASVFHMKFRFAEFRVQVRVMTGKNASREKCFRLGWQIPRNFPDHELA